jgi:ABC-type sugar transport system ATPase subunit
MTAPRERIRLEGVAKKFGKVIAVYPTDMEVAQGEFVVILGPSGCGKTTTLRMLAGLESPSQGRVFINGKDVTALRPGDRDIAFVFQMFSLYPHLTVRENVAFTMVAQGRPRPEALRRAGDMLRHLGLGVLGDVRPGSLSGGDQQRVDIQEAEIAASTDDDQLLAVSEALDKLAVDHKVEAELVKLRYFVGMTNDEAAAVLGISPRTAKYYWTHARAWLFREISSHDFQGK